MTSGTGFGGREHKSLELPLCTRQMPCLALSPGAAAFSEHAGQGEARVSEKRHTRVYRTRPYNCSVRDMGVEKKSAASLETLRRRLVSESVKSFSGQTARKRSQFRGACVLVGDPDDSGSGNI